MVAAGMLGKGARTIGPVWAYSELQTTRISPEKTAVAIFLLMADSALTFNTDGLSFINEAEVMLGGLGG